jgi:hypothetical protein
LRRRQGRVGLVRLAESLEVQNRIEYKTDIWKRKELRQCQGLWRRPSVSPQAFNESATNNNNNTKPRYSTQLSSLSLARDPKTNARQMFAEMILPFDVASV